MRPSPAWTGIGSSTSPCWMMENRSFDHLLGFSSNSKHYDEKAMATLAIAIGQVNFFVRLAVIGKPLPGKPPADQWT